MQTSSRLAAVAILIAIGAPALAQETGGGPPGPGSRYGLEPSSDYGYGRDYRYSRNYYPAYGGRAYDQGYYRNDGFNPFDAAAGVVGSAVGTAGAIATAPFRAFNGNDSYAMAQGENYCAERYRSYDPASGTFMGYDGRRHPCP